MDRNQLLHQFYQEYPRGRYWVLYCSCSISRTWLMVPSLKVVLHLSMLMICSCIRSFITCPEDYTTLQSDINSVASWITQHHLSFNTSKCKLMYDCDKASTKLCKPTCFTTEWETHAWKMWLAINTWVVSRAQWAHSVASSIICTCRAFSSRPPLVIVWVVVSSHMHAW